MHPMYKSCANTTVDVQTIEDGSVETARKVLINNVIYILRGDHIYTIQGQEVR